MISIRMREDEPPEMGDPISLAPRDGVDQLALERLDCGFLGEPSRNRHASGFAQLTAIVDVDHRLPTARRFDYGAGTATDVENVDVRVGHYCAASDRGPFVRSVTKWQSSLRTGPDGNFVCAFSTPESG